MTFKCIIHEPMYEHNNKKYIRIMLNPMSRNFVTHWHQKTPLNGDVRDNPLDGNILTVKVPYRYRRVLCKVEGTKPVQSMSKGDEVEADVEFMGSWHKDKYCGWSWKLKHIKFISEDIL